MRVLLLWCMLALAVVARAEEEQVVQPEEVVDLLEDEDARIDVARMLGDLFHFSDEDDETHDSELGINREARAKNEEPSEVESKAVVDPEDQARYNKFMDTFYRRLNADARSTIDPMEVPLTAGKAKKAKNGAGKDKAKKGGAKKGAEKKKERQQDNKNGSNKDDADKKNKKKQKKGNNKKTGRHPRKLTFEYVTDDDEWSVAEEDHHIVTREAEEVEEIEGDEDELAEESQGRSADVDTKSAVARRTPESKKKAGKPGNKNAGKRNKNKNKNKNRKQNKNKKNNKNKNKKSKRSANKKNDKKGNDKKKGKSNKGPQTSKASVSGIASLVRSGDVSVVNRKDGKELRSDFTIGPVKLKINRRFGSGKDAEMRSATASSPQLTGKMNLYVAANGKAKITKFTINRPSVVTIDGTLSRDVNKRAGKNNFMEMSIARSTPFAAKKLKLAARDVLQATESKN